jgi:hypothetical protein
MKQSVFFRLVGIADLVLIVAIVLALMGGGARGQEMGGPTQLLAHYL